MRFDNIAIVIEKGPEDADYSTYSPSLPGCFSNGRTIEKARRNTCVGRSSTVACCSLTRAGAAVPLTSSANRAPADAQHRTRLRGRRARPRRSRPLSAFCAPLYPRQRRHGFPGSHGPDEPKVKQRLVNILLPATDASGRARRGRVRENSYDRLHWQRGRLRVRNSREQTRSARAPCFSAGAMSWAARRSDRARARELLPHRIRTNPTRAAGLHPCARTNPNPNEPEPLPSLELRWE